LYGPTLSNAPRKPNEAGSPVRSQRKSNWAGLQSPLSSLVEKPSSKKRGRALSMKPQIERGRKNRAVAEVPDILWGSHPVLVMHAWALAHARRAARASHEAKDTTSLQPLRSDGASCTSRLSDGGCTFPRSSARSRPAGLPPRARILAPARRPGVGPACSCPSSAGGCRPRPSQPARPPAPPSRGRCPGGASCRNLSCGGGCTPASSFSSSSSRHLCHRCGGEPHKTPSSGVGRKASVPGSRRCHRSARR